MEDVRHLTLRGDDFEKTKFLAEKIVDEIEESRLSPEQLILTLALVMNVVDFVFKSEGNFIKSVCSSALMHFETDVPKGQA